MCEITTFSANYKDNALKLKHTPLYPHAIFRCFSCFSLCPVEGALWWALLFRCFMKKRVHLGCEVYRGQLDYFDAESISLYRMCKCKFLVEGGKISRFST